MTTPLNKIWYSIAPINTIITVDMSKEFGPNIPDSILVYSKKKTK